MREVVSLCVVMMIAAQTLLNYLERDFLSAGGKMTFESFMAKALYSPDYGYYTKGIENVGGARGDFATSATLSGALGRGVAKWIEEERAYHGWKRSYTIIEIGAGNGALAAQVLRSLGWWGRCRVDYCIVEVSTPLRELQRRRLRNYRVRWADDMPSALASAGGRALVFSNELVDAFPACWLQWSAAEGSWREVMVEFERQSGLRETFRPWHQEEGGAVCSILSGKGWRDGQRVEIQPSYYHWLASWANQWECGSMLTVDYGADAEALYQGKLEGSLRGYYRHQRFSGSGVYGRVGKQDITLDVNFTDLRAWGHSFGWGAAWEGSQAEFLSQHGEGEDQMAESGPGEAFRVLHQRANFEAGQRETAALPSE